MRKRAAVVAAALGVAVLPRVARADVDQALSVEPWGFTQRAIVLVYDAYAFKRVSVVPRVGVRWSSSGDFDSLIVHDGLELRGWFTRHTVGSAQTGNLGPYAYGRVDGNWTHVKLHGRDIGNTFTLAHQAGLGYRFLFWERLEVTPSGGLGLEWQFDGRGRVPPWVHVMASWTVTTGVMF